MNREEVVDSLLQNPYIEVVAHFSVALLLLAIFLALFERVASYNAWDEISKGNVAVAMSVGGKIFGICNVFRYAIDAGETIYSAILWGVLGFVLLVLAYFIYEFLTPVFKVDRELADGNRAVGLFSLAISVALSYVIGASVIG